MVDSVAPPNTMGFFRALVVDLVTPALDRDGVDKQKFFQWLDDLAVRESRLQATQGSSGQIPILLPIAISKPFSALARGLASNPKLTAGQISVFIPIAIGRPDSELAEGLASNPKLTVDQISEEQLIHIAIGSPDSEFVESLASNPKLTANQISVLIPIAIGNPDSRLARGLASNPNLTNVDTTDVDKELDKKFAQYLPKSVRGSLLVLREDHHHQES